MLKNPTSNRMTFDWNELQQCGNVVKRQWHDETEICNTNYTDIDIVCT